MMKSILNTLFGVYEPIVDASGVHAVGAAGVDWTYVLGVLLFAICLYSFFRIVGAVIQK